MRAVIVYDRLRHKEKPMSLTLTKKDWDRFDEQTKDNFRSKGVDLDEPEPVKAVSKPITQDAPKEKVERTGGMTEYVAGWLVLSIGVTFHLIGTGLTALGAWVVKSGYRIRDR